MECNVCSALLSGSAVKGAFLLSSGNATTRCSRSRCPGPACSPRSAWSYPWARSAR